MLKAETKTMRQGLSRLPQNPVAPSTVPGTWQELNKYQMTTYMDRVERLTAKGGNAGSINYKKYTEPNRSMMKNKIHQKIPPTCSSVLIQ